MTYKDIAHYHSGRSGRVATKQEAIDYCESKGLELCSTEELKSHRICDYQWSLTVHDGAYYAMRSINRWRQLFSNTREDKGMKCEFVWVGDRKKESCVSAESDWWDDCTSIPFALGGPSTDRNKYAFSCGGNVEQTSNIHWNASKINEWRVYSNFEQMCKRQGKRLCTYNELCPSNMTSMQGIYVKDEQEFAVVKDNQGFAGGFPLNQIYGSRLKRATSTTTSGFKQETAREGIAPHSLTTTPAMQIRVFV